MPSASIPLEIDEERRELRGGGRVLTPQPRVFDLIAYLARYRDRVVPKEELLEKLWAEVIVTDASLQRAVSLARSACEELGVVGAIRTYARQGYRFVLGRFEPVESNRSRPPAANGASPELIEARASYAAAKWEQAIAQLHAVDLREGLLAEDLRRWAHAAQCAGWMPQVALPLERAVAAYAARGDVCRAGWVAILLCQIYLDDRDPVAAKGWLHRATRLLEGNPDSREYGYLNYLWARFGRAASEYDPALAAARRAHELGRKHADPDLENLGLYYTGDILLTMGRVDEGMALMDEAGVAVRSCSVSPVCGSIIYCGVISIAMVRADWERASRWADVFQAWCEEHGAHALPGLCRLHRAEVLIVRGALSEAQREGENARVELAIRSPWIEGEAWRVLGDIHLGKGNLKAAEEAYLRAHEFGWDTQPGFSLLELERGNTAQALRLITRALDDRTWSGHQRRGLLLAHCVVIALRAGDENQARVALAELDANPPLWSTSALRALVTFARGETVARETPAEAVALMRSAIQQWLAIESPLPAAQARCRLAELFIAAGDFATAEMELSAAANAFARAGAEASLDHCRAISRKLASTTESPPPRRRRSHPVASDRVG